MIILIILDAYFLLLVGVESVIFFNRLAANRIKTLFLAVITLFSVLGWAQSAVPVIPKPQQEGTPAGRFSIKNCTVNDTGFEARYLAQQLKNYFARETKVKPDTFISTNGINFFIIRSDSDAKYSAENYHLYIGHERIIINAFTKAGWFHGVQTLLQMVNPGDATLPCLNIADGPRYPWRGMHLDVCRHFFTKEEVKKYIDYLALYKFNVFHWHLTEDQGWRIEIKKYPRLTEVGAWRKGSQVGPYSKQEYDTVRYGGFYTQQEIKEIVKYASDRHITIVPEIEMPGHSLAALAAYPNLSCAGGSFNVAKGWGVFDDVYCAKEETFKFLENVLDEVCALFPGEYIHIGGDECPKTRWKTCANCQARMKEEKLKDEHELQSYFIKRMEKYLNKKGKQIIGWDEILEGGLAPNAAVMSWRGTDGGIAAAKEKHFVVMTPGRPCYFDHYQSKEIVKEPLAIGGYNPLDSVYAYNPTPKNLSAEEKKYILGAQGNVWTEYMTDFKQVEYMALPRMAALAEALWTKPENKNYEDFLVRLKQNTFILDKMGANYAKHFLTP